jgi:CubicO group peptidase (beta-lactamase class C family)
MSIEFDARLNLHGRCDARFTAVHDTLAEMLQSGEEFGASLVVSVAGNDVLDLWGGWANKARTRPWDKDTIVNVWSTTKTVTALAVLMLIDRGELDPFAPVVTYWPEFAANG